jgi:phage shock protein E
MVAFVPSFLVLFAFFSPDFSLRAKEFGIASEPQVTALAKLPKALLLDVRSPPEIAMSKLNPTKLKWAHSFVTPFGAPELEKNAKAVVGSNKSTPIIIYCGTGKRASIAKKILESQGYTNVVNAGGLGDVDYLRKF